MKATRRFPRMVKERVARRISLFGLASDEESADSGTAGVEWRYRDGPAGPGIACCVSPGARVRLRTTLNGRVRFSTAVSLDGEGPDSNSVEVALVVSATGGGLIHRSSQRIARRARAGQGAWEEWEVALGRFRGESVEIVLSAGASESETRGAFAVLGNPTLSVEPPFRVILFRMVRKVWVTLRAEGPGGVLCELAGALDPEWGRRLRYRRWCGREEALPHTGVPSQSGGPAALRPLISFLVEVGPGAVGAHVLRLLDSVVAQRSEDWELLAIVDPGTDPGTLTGLRQRARSDPRIRVLEAGEDWPQALNRGLGEATGTFVALLPPKGEVAPDAVAEVGALVDRSPDADIVYSDEDRLDSWGRRRDPFFKPDWSLHYLLSYAYVGQLCLFRTTLVRSAGSFRPGIRGAEAYDLLLRLQGRAREIRHVSKILWHRYSEPGPGPLPFGRDEVIDRKVLADYLHETGADATVEAGLIRCTFRVKWRVRRSPLVSVVIPTRDQVRLLRRCLAGIRERTAYRNVEVVIVDNGSVEPATWEFFDRCGAKIVRDPGPFNFARLCNIGARQARGEHLLFLNNDTEPCSGDWLEAMIELSERRDVGAVGAKLYYPDGRLQHVGIVVGLYGAAAQVFRGAPHEHPGYLGSAFTIRECSAVTGACLMTRQEVHEELGGFDETFGVNFNDVDYCLRVQERGYRVVFTPFARLFHYEFATRARNERVPEMNRFQQRWADTVRRDPYYNPNLSLRHDDYSVRL